MSFTEQQPSLTSVLACTQESLTLLLELVLSMTEDAKKISPQPKDILSGRGRGLSNHAGNKVFNDIIKEHALAYHDASETRGGRKSLIVKLIRQRLSGDNMRLLQKNKNGDWVELDKAHSTLKISHALRDSKGQRRLSAQAQKCIATLSDYNVLVQKRIRVTTTQSHAKDPGTKLLLENPSDHQQHRTTTEDDGCFNADLTYTREIDSLLSLQHSTVSEPLETCVESRMEPTEPLFSHVVSEEDKEEALYSDFPMDLSAEPLETCVHWFMEPIGPPFSHAVSEEDNGDADFLLHLSTADADETFGPNVS